MRVLIEYLVPVFLPTALWLLWLSWAQRRARANGKAIPALQAVPWTWLLAAGVMLALLIVIGGTFVAGYSTGRYEPARLDSQGHLVPGRFD